MDDLSALIGGGPSIPDSPPPPPAPEAVTPDPDMLARQRRADELRRRGRASLNIDPNAGTDQGTGIRIL